MLLLIKNNMFISNGIRTEGSEMFYFIFFYFLLFFLFFTIECEFLACCHVILDVLCNGCEGRIAGFHTPINKQRVWLLLLLNVLL